MCIDTSVLEIRSVCTIKYILEPPRTKVSNLCREPSWLGQWYIAHNNANVSDKAVENYIKRRDAKVQAVKPIEINFDDSDDFRVSLEQIINLVIKDGCTTWADWKKECFKRHGHGSSERNTFIKIMQHV